MASESAMEPTGRSKTRSGVIYSPEFRRGRQRTSQGTGSTSKGSSLNTSYESEQNLKNTSSTYETSFTESSGYTVTKSSASSSHSSGGGIVVLGNAARSGSNRSTRSAGSGSRKSAASSGSGRSLQGGRAVSKETVSVTTVTTTSESQSWQSSETTAVTGSSGVVNGFSTSAIESSATQAVVGDAVASATLSTRSGSGRSSSALSAGSGSNRSSGLLVSGTGLLVGGTSSTALQSTEVISTNLGSLSTRSGSGRSTGSNRSSGLLVGGTSSTALQSTEVISTNLGSLSTRSGSGRSTGSNRSSGLLVGGTSSSALQSTEVITTNVGSLSTRSGSGRSTGSNRSGGLLVGGTSSALQSTEVISTNLGSLSTRSGSGRSTGSNRSGRSNTLLVGGTVSSVLQTAGGTSPEIVVTDVTQSESSTGKGVTSYLQGSGSHSSAASSIRGSSGKRSVVHSSSHGSSSSERAAVTGVTSETAISQSATTLSSGGSSSSRQLFAQTSSSIKGGSGRSAGLLVVGGSGSRSSQTRAGSADISSRGSSHSSSPSRLLTSEKVVTQTSISSQQSTNRGLGLAGGILASTPKTAAASSGLVTKETKVTTATVIKEGGSSSSADQSGSYRFPIYILRKVRSLLGWQERAEVQEVQDLDTLKEAYDTPKMMRRGLRGSSKSKFDDSIIEDSVTEGSFSYSESKTKESRSTNQARRRHSGKEQSGVVAGSIYGTTEKSIASEKTLSKLYESESVTQDRLSYESDGEYGDYTDSAYSETTDRLTVWEMITRPFIGLFWWLWWLVGTPVYWFVTTVMMLDAWILSRVTILKNTVLGRKGAVFAAFPLRFLLLPLLLLLLLLALYYLWPLSFLTGVASSVTSAPGALLAWLPWSSGGTTTPVRLHMTMHEKVLNDFRAEQIRTEMRSEIQRLSATVADVVRKWEQSSQAGSGLSSQAAVGTQQSASAAALAGGMSKDEMIALITAIVKEHMEGLRKDVTVQDQAILADMEKLRVERENQLAMLEMKMQTINTHSEDLTKQLVEAKQKIHVETSGGVGTSTDMLEHIHRLESELASLKMELGRVQQQSDLYHQELKKYSMNISLIEQQLSITVQQALQEDSSALVGWLKSHFVGQSDFDSKVNDIVSRVTDNVSQKLKVETSVSRSSAGEISVDDERIRAIVNKHIGIYDADKTGMVDHALESAGGSVLSLRCTETYESKSAQLSILGIPLWYKTNSPRTVIQPDVHPGNCWAFKGSEGYMVIQLSGVVKPTSFSLEHIPKSLSPTGQIDSAPKDFAVYGLEDETQAEGDLLGNYTYDDNADPLQYFPVQVNDVKPYPIVELRILNNHGNPDYTCIYRFRVHGILQKGGD